MSDQPRSLWSELKQRKVVRVATVYAAVGWAVTVGGNELTQILQLPTWVPRLVLALVVLGFPVAMVLAWAFELTPEGVRRAAPLPSPTESRPSRKPFFAGVAVGVASLSILAFLVREDSATGDGDGLDENLVAIVPFTYSGPPDLEYLGDGVAHLLASRFTGEVGPRAADAAATAALWDVAGSANPVTATREVAAQLGAGLVLTGSVVAGPDGLTVSVTLAGALDDTERASASARGPVDSLTAVVERLGGGILSLSVGDYGESLAQLTSTSPEALREYLLGQVEFSRARIDEAHAHFSRAVDVDSTFALASLWEADAANNVSGARPGALERAWRHRDRLSERDRMYLTARLGPNYPDPSTRAERQRSYLDALRLSPDRANLLYWLGENVLHSPTSRASHDEAYRYFERAVELDPRNGNALLHLWSSAMLRGDTAAILAAEERLANVDTTEQAEVALRYVRLVLGSDSIAAASLVDALPVGAYVAGFLDAPVLLTGGWQVARLRADLDSARMALTPGGAFGDAHSYVYFGYQDLGRPSQAAEVIDQFDRGAAAPLLTTRLFDATYGALPERVGPAAAAAIESSLAAVSGEGWTPVLLTRRYALELWRLSRSDTSGVADAVRLLRTRQTAFPAATAKGLEAQALLLEAMVQSRRGDPAARGTIEAMDRLFLEGPAGLGVILSDAMVLATAEVYERLGEPAAALLALERESNFSNTTWPFNARFARERGRLAAIVGDTARAIRDYEFYLRLRAFAEPSLAPEVAEVQAALDALRP